LLIFAGNQAEMSLNQLRSFTNLTLTWDANTGKINASGEAKNNVDRMLLNIINNQKITVNITATDGDIRNPKGGGAFWGNKVSFYDNDNSTNQSFNPFMKLLNVKGVSTDQRVNPVTNYIFDTFGVRGQTIFHEITESFNGGLLSMIFGKSALPAERGNSTYKTIYEPAHESAYPQPLPEKRGDFERRMKIIDDIKYYLDKYKVW
jgi:hypothetical protein